MPFFRILPLLLLFELTAGAHPAGGKPASHRMRVQVLQDQLVIAYLAELPNRLLLQHLADHNASGSEGYSDLYRTLSQGISASFQGAPVELSAEEFTPERVRQNPRSTAFEIQFAALRPGEAGDLVIRNANLADQHAFFFTEVSAEDPIALDSSSLLSSTDGQTEIDFNGRWSVLESHRELVLSISDWRMHDSRGSMRKGPMLLTKKKDRSSPEGFWIGVAMAGAMTILWRRYSRKPAAE